MYHIIYQSVAVAPPTRQDLRYLLWQSRINNVSRHITGLLLCSAGHYLQVLEGEQAEVEQLFEVIRHDSRHRKVTIISAGPISERVFSVWAMSYQGLSVESFTRLMGYLNRYQMVSPTARVPEPDEGLRMLLKSFMQPQTI